MANLLGTTVNGSLLIGPSGTANAYDGAATGKLYFGNQVSDSPTHYHITTNMENYNGNYSKLDIRWYTGQRFFAHTGYGGFRFYEITSGTELFSVGRGDSHVRVENNLYVGNTIYNNGNAVIHAGNIGSQSVSYATSAGNSATTSQRSFDYLYTSSYLESAGAVYGTIFYDNNDRAFYLDPNSGSRLNAITYDNLYWAGDTTYGFIGRNVYADTVNGRGGDPLELNYYDGGPVKIGSGTYGSKDLYASMVYVSSGNAVIHAGNIGSQAVDFSSRAEFQTIPDYRGNAFTPNEYSGNRVWWHFNNKDTVGGYGTYWNAIQTVSPWSEYDPSHRQQQIQWGGTDISFRYATSGTTWSSWYRFITDNNIGSQSVSYASSAGNSATTSQRDFSEDISTSGQGRFAGWYSGNAQTGVAAEIGMSGGQGYIFVYNRQASTYGTLNIAASGANLQISGSTINATAGTLQQGGNNVIHSGNIGSQSVNYASSAGNSNTTSQIAFTDFKANFPSGVGGGHFFGPNHYSMGLDSGNGGWSHPHYRDLIIGYHTGVRIGAHYSGIRFYNDSPTTDENNDGNGDRGEALLMTIGGYVGTENHTDVVVNNNLFANVSMRAPIFYDSNDTNYYGDFAATSRFSRLLVQQAGVNSTAGPALRVSKGWDNGTPDIIYDTVVIESNDVTTIRMKEADGGTAGWSTGDGNTSFTSNVPMRFYTGGNESSYIYSGQGGTLAMYISNDQKVGIGTSDFSYATGDNTPVVGSGHTTNKLYVNGSIQLLSNDDAIVIGRGTATFLKDEEIGFGWGGGWYMTDETYLRVRNNKILYSTGEVRSGGYRGTTNVGGTGEASWHPAGIYVGSTQWLYGTQYRNGSTTSGQGWMYLDYNYGHSIVGLYDSRRYQGVWAMGDAYKLPVDGTTTGSLYGLAWSHPNAGGVAENLNTHGLLVMENGTFLAAISGSIRARDDMRAPIFYDSNDTGYYLDPNGTSNLLQLNTSTRARWGMPRWWNDRSANTSDQGYWTGTNGWGVDYGNWSNAWRGGFSGWDIWGTGTDHPQGGGYIHAQGIVSGQHYASSDGSSAYGWMMVGAANATENRYWLRGKWGGSTSGWVEMYTTGNMDAPNKAGTSYYQTNTWMQFNGSYGLYWPGYYGAHFHPNTSNSYCQFMLQGNKNGYGGIYDYHSRVNGFMYDGEGNGGVYREGNGLWYFYYHLGNNCMAIGDSGTSSAYKLYVHGTIYATGDVIAYSDSRKKTNVVTIDNALNKVLSMRGVFYDKVDEPQKGRQVGVIAQEINQVLPEAVSYASDIDEYGVKYGNIVGVLIEAIKEQQAQIDELKSIINGLTT